MTRYFHFITVLFLLLSAVVAPANAVDIHTRAPNFSLSVMANANAGSKLGLKDFKGKIIYVDFWASWCGPCRKSLPALNTLRNKYSRDQFEVIAINLDENPDDALDFLRKYNVDYPVVYDPKQATPASYQIKGMPTAFLIDEEGIVRYVHNGFKEKDIADIEAALKNLLEKG